MSTAANIDEFTGDKTITAQDRFEAMLMAQRNLSVVAEFSAALPLDALALLERNAALLTKIAE